MSRHRSCSSERAEKKGSHGPISWQGAQPHSGSVHWRGAAGGPELFLLLPPPFSSSPQSISDAFLHSSNKRPNSISSTVRPCEISFASLFLSVPVRTSGPSSCFVCLRLCLRGWSWATINSRGSGQYIIYTHNF